MFHIYVIEYNRFYGLYNCLFPQKKGEKLYRFTKTKGVNREKLYENTFHINVKILGRVLIRRQYQ